MKKLLLFVFLFTLSAASGQKIEPRPNPPRLVNDFADVLSPDQEAALERKLIAYDDSTSTQIAIITILTAGDYGVEQVALKYLRDWGVGNKNNNGVVILSAIQDRDIRIETGYGMEGVLPDITAQQIIKNEMAPGFRANNYYRGFDAATNAIFKAAAGEYKAPEGYNKRGKSRGGPVGFIVLVIVIIIISFLRGGGKGGGMMSRRGFSPWILGPMAGGGFGGGGGGGWSGGGGGGFGGFGGGGGGGGGASGSW
ncbi:MAG: TPM domain-containing protein [Chitinophagaceae bacterium]|nr:TPM domain-containing protein [Chitinophagaceae bacterium]